MFRSPRHQDAALGLVMEQVEKLLKGMQQEGVDLMQIKMKKFQKTHHIDCACSKCKKAKIKNNPKLRGLLENGFKIYVE